MLHSRVIVLATLLLVSSPRLASAYGESNADGFPNWSERVLHEWTNRARCEPSVEMAACGTTKCPEGSCYTPIAPVYYSLALNRAARFHSEEMAAQGYFGHDSQCTLVSGISGLYPGSCTGAATCACVGGTKACSPTCTSWSARVGMFGTSTSGEIIASGTDPNGAFYQWLFESYNKTTCGFDFGPPTNGHRYNILKAGPNVGYGSKGAAVGDFGGGGTTYKIPSAAHYPRQSASIEVWANWYDTAAPTSAVVNVGGTCTPLVRSRGTGTNGAWKATLTTYATGCYRYFVEFKDSGGASVTYPSTGSLGIGPAGSCADWDATRPAGCGGGTDAGVVDTGTPVDTGTTVVDTGTIKVDTGTVVDTGSVTPADTGATSDDSSVVDDSATDATTDDSTIGDDASVASDTGSIGSLDPASDSNGEIQGSCACRAGAGGSHAGAPAWFALAAFAVVARSRRRRLAGVTLACVLGAAACKDYKPAPLNPAPAEAGKKHCTTGADCASGACGSDGRCL